jgi:16S rRNA processing protein RimM
MSNREDELVLGILRASFGFRGEIRVQSLSGETEHLKKFKELRLRKDGVEKRLKVERFGSCPSGLTVKLVGVESLEAAAPLSGWEILGSRKEACPLSKDEYYVTDLVGCAVWAEGQERGRIVSVSDSSADDLLEVERSDGVRAFVPFRREFVGRVDVAASRVELENLWILGYDSPS